MENKGHRNLKPIQKGEVRNPNGRPKKMKTLLGRQGYRLSDINDTIQIMMLMDLEELKKVFEDPKSTILEKTVANALRKSMEKGKLDSMETLLTRVYGKPKEKLEQEINVTNHKIQLKFGNGEGENTSKQ
jgi:hypothetical protein